MRQVLPELSGTADVDPFTVYVTDDRSPRPDRPWVLLNMIASADGATALDGVSGGLGGPADKRVFAAIRAIADVIVVAAGTVRAERYGPPRPSEATRAARRARGQQATPRVAIVTRHIDLDLSSPVFTDAEQRPLVLTTDAAGDERRRATANVADVRTHGSDLVDLGAAFTGLREDGASTVLVEGGPSLNGALVSAGLIDELCLTVAPMLVGGSSARIAHGDEGEATPMVLRHVLEDEGLLFLRYTRA